MTKREIRCCALSHLALTSEAVCWDVGPPMEADGDYVLIGCLQPGAQRLHGAESRQHPGLAALSHLALTSEAVCWDVGAGTGSVSIEMALLARKGRVYAVEKNENALALLAENRKKFHVSNLEIVPGRAPEACRELPVPTHVFSLPPDAPPSESPGERGAAASPARRSAFRWR